MLRCRDIVIAALWLLTATESGRSRAFEVSGNVWSTLQKDVFKLEPQNRMLFRDYPTTIVFHCKIRRDQVVYSWQKDGETFPRRADPRYVFDEGTLQITDATTSDAGLYACLARTREGTYMSNFARLDVAYFNEMRTGVTAVETSVGRGAYLVCPVAGYYPGDAAVFHWTNDRDEVYIARDDPEYYVSPIAGRFYIINPRLWDRRWYRCVAKLKWFLGGAVVRDERTSNPIELVVRPARNISKPFFLVKPAAQSNGVPGERMYIECIAGGNPTPRVTWKKVYSMERGFTDQNRVLGNVYRSGLYEIPKANISHLGIYECTAENRLGAIKARTEVVLRFRPQVVKGMQSRRVQFDTTARLSCASGAFPPAQYKWYKNAVPIRGGFKTEIVATGGQLSRSELIVHRFARKDSAVYQCVAWNEEGSLVASAVLTGVAHIVHDRNPQARAAVAASGAKRARAFELHAMRVLVASHVALAIVPLRG